MATANWPRDTFAVDMRKAIPLSVITLDNGTRVDVPALQNLPFPPDIIPENIVPQIITTSPYVIGGGFSYYVVNRVGANDPLATSITLPLTSLQDAPIYIFDWSTAFTTHTITVFPTSPETINRDASFPMVSVIGELGFRQLTSGLFVPFASLSGWGAR